MSEGAESLEKVRKGVERLERNNNVPFPYCLVNVSERKVKVKVSVSERRKQQKKKRVLMFVYVSLPMVYVRWLVVVGKLLSKGSFFG